MAMKNRKTIIVAFMLLACMLLGVGYAALTDTLTIAGQANVTTGESSDEFKEDIYFKSANATAPDTATVLTDNNRASFTVNSLSLDGDTATFTFVIANESEHEATVAITATTIRDLIADGADSELDDDNVFTVTPSWTSTTIAAATDPADPATAGTTTLTLVVELNGNPTNAVTGYFDITITATTVD